MNRKYNNDGFALPLVIAVMVMLIILAIGAMMSSFGSRIQAVRTKAETEAMLAAEAGYERAIFWMSQQTDILGAIQAGSGTGNIDFGTSRCEYEINFQEFMGARPVFQVLSTGVSGRPSFTRVVDVAVMQETSGWAMGACRVPYSASSLNAVNFVSGEMIDMQLHINRYNDSPDVADIFINGTPRFLRKVEMGESRKNGGSDKNIVNSSGTVIGSYTSAMPCFEGGIDFDQPNVRITDAAAVQSKVNRFRDSTDTTYRFTPVASTLVPASSSAPRQAVVQLEFYVVGETGYVKITNHCTIKCCPKRDSDNYTYDYNMPGTGGNPFKRYNIYSYHYAPDVNENPSYQIVALITNTYVTQTFGGYTSEPGGQIYVNGNVIIGGQGPPSNPDPDQVVKGKITVVATGNIWIGDNIVVHGDHDADGMPSADNPNVLGLIAQGVIKVIDPGISNYAPSTANVTYPGRPGQSGEPALTYGSGAAKIYYQPVGNGTLWTRVRTLPDPTVVEAALTVGGGGWGAENVTRRYGSTTYGGRKEFSGTKDDLIVRGSLTECVRGVVGYPSPYEDGYDKNYFVDTRLMSGILPGDIWFSGKYIPAPAGWHDRSAND